MSEAINIFTVSILIITCIITGIVTYSTSNNQFKKELEKVKQQCDTDLKKVQEQCETDIEKVRKQCQTEIDKITKQCQSDIEKIEKQSQAEIKKLMAEFDKQADAYERNKQTDMFAKFMEKMMDSTNESTTGLNSIMNLINMFKNMNK